MAGAALREALAAPVNELTVHAHRRTRSGRASAVRLGFVEARELLDREERLLLIPLVRRRKRSCAAAVRLRCLTGVTVERTCERARALEAHAHRDGERAVIALGQERHRLQEAALLEVL